jgi:protease-4
MPLAIDQIIDRRQLRRKVTFWRVVALTILAVLLVSLVLASGVIDSATKTRKPHIARIGITGFITEDKNLIELIGKAKSDEHVKGVILEVDSPGGSTVGGEAIFNAVRELAKVKPVTARIGTLAASAGYMIASASDHIVARRSSIVGSIGVLFQYADASELMKTVGIKMEEVKSSPLKAEPSPFHPAPPEARAMLQRLIDDSYNWFVDLVTERRPLNRAEVLKLADGSIFTGAQGLENKLVDAIGGEDVAKAWLTREKGLSEDLKILDWRVADDSNPFSLSHLALIWIARKTGLDTNQSAINHLKKSLPQRIFLDGLVSFWHASTPVTIKEGEIH